MSTHGDGEKPFSIPMRRLGGSGLYVSELGLGAMTFSTDGKSTAPPHTPLSYMRTREH